MLKQQEEELAGQTKLLEELKGKLASERASHSRHTSSRSQEHQSHRSSRDDGRRHADREKEYSRHRSEPREHQSESRKHEDRDQHRPRERESSVTSSRHSSNRREGDRSRREREREHSRTGRIQEEPEMRHDSHHEEINEAPQQAAEASPIAERSISINGAASKHASGQAPALPSADKLARLPHQESKNVALADEDNEIDLGEDLLLEEEEAPPVKPAPAPARKERPRSRERHRSHDANHRTRSRSPTRTRREEDEVSRRHEQDDRQVQPSGMKSPSREARRDGSPARQSSTEDKAIRDRKRDSAASRNRSNMFGRLGLPLSADGGRSGLSIRGAGRNSKT